MAVTQVSTQTDRVLAEIIAAKLLNASYPEIVASRHINVDMDMIGQPATAKAYPRLADDGAAGTASEASDITDVTTASLGTQLVLTPTEAAAIRFDLTDKVARKRAPGIASVHEALDTRNMPALFAIFGEEIMRQYKACYEKLEVDVMALLDDFSTTAGSSGVNMSLANARAALLSLTNKETGRQGDWAWVLAPVQVSDLIDEIAITGGGMGGGVWTTDIQSIVNARPGLDPDGLVGGLFGIPVYQTSTSTNPSPNSGADEAGALMVRGVGHPEGDRPGALCMLIGEPIHTRFDVDVSKRETEIITIWEYAVGERADDFGISIITDA